MVGAGIGSIEYVHVLYAQRLKLVKEQISSHLAAEQKLTTFMISHEIVCTKSWQGIQLGPMSLAANGITEANSAGLPYHRLILYHDASTIQER